MLNLKNLDIHQKLDILGDMIMFLFIKEFGEQAFIELLKKRGWSHLLKIKKDKV